MTQNSINDLSDYFADIVLNTMKMKSSTQVAEANVRITAYEKTLKIHRAFRDAEEAGVVLESALADAIEDAVNEKLKFTAMDWNREELHMQCIHGEIVPESTPTNLFLLYRIQVSELVMMFTCQVGEDGVFNYQLTVDCGPTEHLWDYYFDRTPCALM